MKKYLVEYKCEATEMLGISTNRTHIAYYGKGSGAVCRQCFPTKNIAEAFGFNSVEEATPTLKRRSRRAGEETYCGLWDARARIVEVEI